MCLDLRGYHNLCRLLTVGRRTHVKGRSGVTLVDVEGHHEGLVYLVPDVETDEDRVGRLVEVFGDRAYLTCTEHLLPASRRRRTRALARSARFGVPVVAVNDALYHAPERRTLCDVITCIRHGTTLREAGRRLAPNAERCLKSPRDMAGLFDAHPDLVGRSVEVAERCEFTLDQIRYRYPAEMLPVGLSALAYLEQLVREGMRRRYGEDVPERVREQVRKELSIIGALDYSGYFLTIYDIVCFARERGILCQGRGSAANSAVCYVLGITSLDPVSMDLLFERFVSMERAEPPDIDVDFEHERREEVIQYIYEKYGRARAGMVAAVITYRGRSAVRDVGKAFGLSLEQVDRLSKALGREGMEALGEDLWADTVRGAGLDPADDTVRKVIACAHVLQGFPRHLSIHSGGFVIAQEDLSSLVPIENASMPGRTVIQWDKDDLDIVGMFKIDVLALGMLTAVHKCFQLMQKNQGVDLDMARVLALQDERVYDMICAADTVGLFQIESRAQMSMLPRLKPRSYYDLVVEVAIVRPGPIQGGMVHPYLRRRRGEEPVEVPHPALTPILGRTFGVPLFQEQVMRMAVAVAGFTPGEADNLRRAMGAWRRRGGLEKWRAKLMDGMTRNGITAEYADRLCRQIEGFGEYGFPESHAASFALIVYVTAWQKLHHPAAFFCALLNSQPMGFYAPHTLVSDAQRHGVEVRPIDVTASDYDCTLDPGVGGGRPALRLGMRLVKGMHEESARRAEVARARDGPWRSVGDFARRSGMTRLLMVRLAAVGAFERIVAGPRQALWEVQALDRVQGTLFEEVASLEPAARLPEVSAVERLKTEYAVQGLSLDLHPVALIREELQARGILSAVETKRARDGTRVTVGGMVITRQRPETASGMTFMTLEDETGLCDTAIPRKVAARYRREVNGGLLLWVRGVLQRDGEARSVMVQSMGPLGFDSSVSAPSRDFR